MTPGQFIDLLAEAGMLYEESPNVFEWKPTIEKAEKFAKIVAAAKQEQIARQWDALHEQYMADPLRRQMMLSYEMVAKMIRGNAK
jgi:hypothetical protein